MSFVLFITYSKVVQRKLTILEVYKYLLKMLHLMKKASFNVVSVRTAQSIYSECPPTIYTNVSPPLPSSKLFGNKKPRLQIHEELNSEESKMTTLFNRDLLSACLVPGIILSPWDRIVNATNKLLSFLRLHSSRRWKREIYTNNTHIT